jgi:hypothetical protein
MKILTGIISFLSSIILTIAIIVDLLDQPSRYDDYDNGLLMFFLILVLSLIYYLIITKFWRKGSYTSEHLKLDREHQLLKKQVEISRLKKELNELEKFNNTD